ncbi:MAG TPA: alpha/beta hydrolase [Candidatus Angelobacter sp.]|nr:alpha/beta hydrolase [Candidatus Angelobacter sp.]
MNWPGVEFIRVAANGVNFEVATMGSHPNTPDPCALGAPVSGDRLALCLHGFPEHAYSWRYQMPLLAKLGYRVWAPNLRGYGGTDSPQEVSAYKTRTLVEDVAALIKAANPKETLLLAHDWGGALAWSLAIEQARHQKDAGSGGQSQLISKLVMMNMPHPACFARELRRPPQLFLSWYIFFFQLPWLPERMLRRRNGRATSGVFRSTSKNPQRFSNEDLEVYRANAMRPGGLRAMVNWYRAALRGRSLTRFRSAEVPVINIPTLFLWGDADTALSFGNTHGTEKYVSDLTFRVFPGISHWIQQEAPEAVNAMLEAWLSGRPVPEYDEVKQLSHKAPGNA